MRSIPCYYGANLFLHYGSTQSESVFSKESDWSFQELQVEVVKLVCSPQFIYSFRVFLGKDYNGAISGWEEGFETILRGKVLNLG